MSLEREGFDMRLAALFWGSLVFGALIATAEDSSRAIQLEERTTNRGLPSEASDQALSTLAVVDFQRAAKVSTSLLAEKDETLRLRAAWILADGGSAAGLEVLRSMAADESSELLAAPAALGRLRDSKSRELLRDLLARALRSESGKERSRVSALAGALADYGDRRDADLLLQTLKKYFSGSNWVIVDSVGRTGASEAIPELQKIFHHTGLDEAVPAAGLALARCGDEEGLRYVRRMFADADGSSPRMATHSENEHLLIGWDRRFVLENLGTATDAALLPDLLGIIRDSSSPETARAYAWNAVLRMNPARHRDELVALAWRDVAFKAAARFLALNDEEGVRSTTQTPSRAAAMGIGQESRLNLEVALSTSARERRRWREVHGYPF